MKANEGRIAILSIMFIFVLSACSLPIKVQKIDSFSEKANGIRYILKRPSYEVGLRIKDNEFVRMDTDDKIGACVNSCLIDKDIKKKKGVIQYCLKNSEIMDIKKKKGAIQNCLKKNEIKDNKDEICACLVE